MFSGLALLLLSCCLLILILRGRQDNPQPDSDTRTHLFLRYNKLSEMEKTKYNLEAIKKTERILKHFSWALIILHLVIRSCMLLPVKEATEAFFLRLFRISCDSLIFTMGFSLFCFFCKVPLYFFRRKD